MPSGFGGMGFGGKTVLGGNGLGGSVFGGAVNCTTDKGGLFVLSLGSGFSILLTMLGEGEHKSGMEQTATMTDPLLPMSVLLGDVEAEGGSTFFLSLHEGNPGCEISSR